MSKIDIQPPETPCPLGPRRTGNDIISDGRVIPKLTVVKMESGYHLTLDGRFGIEVPDELVHPVIFMISNALAIGQGYSHAGAETKGQPFAPKIAIIGEIPE